MFSSNFLHNVVFISSQNTNDVYTNIFQFLPIRIYLNFKTTALLTLHTFLTLGMIIACVLALVVSSLYDCIELPWRQTNQMLYAQQGMIILPGRLFSPPLSFMSFRIVFSSCLLDVWFLPNELILLSSFLNTGFLSINSQILFGA